MSRKTDTQNVMLSSRRMTTMTITEELRQQAADNGAEVINWKFESTRIKGLYCGGVIAVSDRIDTDAERACVLAEELGHHMTAAGSVIDQNNTGSRKQEQRGRAWAYDRLIGLHGIVKAYKAGCQNRYEIADLLQISESTLQDAIDYYHEKYGLYVKIDNFAICFEPLGVMELF